VIDLAHQEASRYGLEHIGTEHVLLGIILEGSGLGARVLAELHVEAAAVRSAISAVPERTQRIVLNEMLPSSRVDTVLESASEEAGAGQIETEHLLLGLLRERAGVAARALEEMGVDEAAARRVLAEARA
jgi:ATP-dependent Clp protease ATP-binding subunit ClpC